MLTVESESQTFEQLLGSGLALMVSKDPGLCVLNCPVHSDNKTIPAQFPSLLKSIREANAKAQIQTDKITFCVVISKT